VTATGHTVRLLILPPRDSEAMAQMRRRELDIPRSLAAKLGSSAVKAARNGYYFTRAQNKVDWRDLVHNACSAKLSIPPDAELPVPEPRPRHRTIVQVTNETTLQVAHRLNARGSSLLVLNFANGVQPGGGFLHGALAQEEVLCRSSALYSTLADDEMYECHRSRPQPDSTDWAILSPDVPVFRADNGTELDTPWLASFLTCAAPYTPAIGQPASGNLLQRRIHRVLAIAEAYGYAALVLGAWGCGAFGNDPHRTAADFRLALENEFSGVFSDVIFAITDWSREKRYIGPFLTVFS